MINRTISSLILILLLPQLYSQNIEERKISSLKVLLSDSVRNNLTEENIKEYERTYWHLSRRFDQNGNIYGYRSAVKNYYQQEKEASLNKSSFSVSSLNQSTSSSLIWNYLGPKGLGSGNLKYQARNSVGRGWIETINVISENLIYAGARNSGLWVTNDGGESWENISSTEPLINGVLSILIDPTDSDHIIVLTGVQTTSFLDNYSNGIFETFDHGSNWSEIPTIYNSNEIFDGSTDELQAVKIVPNPNNFDDLFLCTGTTLYRRSSISSPWELIYTKQLDFSWLSNVLPIADMAFDKINPNIFYLTGDRAFKCVISGSQITMVDISLEVSAGTVNRFDKCVLGINENFPGKVWFYYIKRSGSPETLTHHVSTYDGISHNPIAQIAPGAGFHDPGFRCFYIYPSSVDQNVAYVGEVPVGKINSNTANYTEISTTALSSSYEAYDVSEFLHADIRHMHVIKVDNKDRIYVGHDGGVAWGEEASGSCSPYYCWHQISDDGDANNDGLYCNEFYGISISNSYPLVIAGGLQDCSSYIYKEETDSWLHAGSSDGYEGAISRTDPNKVLVGGGMGSNRNRLYNLENPNYIKYWTTCLIGSLHSRMKPHPNDDNVIYFGGNSLYQIENCYSTSPIIGTISVPTNLDEKISSFAIGHNNTNIKYIAESFEDEQSSSADHLWRYDPTITNWIDIGSNLPELTTSFVSDIVLNPSDDFEVWVSMAQAENGNRKVFHSENGGTTWTALALGYPIDIPANRLLFDYESELLYAATDVGIFSWDTNYPSMGWTQVAGTMPFKLVTDLEKDYIKNRLIAGTYGRGIWITNLCYDENNPLIYDSNVRLTVDDVICSDIIVRNNSILNISCDITLSKLGKITVEPGSSLIIEGGKLINGNIEIQANANFSIINDGEVELNLGDEIKTESSSTVSITQGKITPIF